MRRPRASCSLTLFRHAPIAPPTGEMSHQIVCLFGEVDFYHLSFDSLNPPVPGNHSLQYLFLNHLILLLEYLLYIPIVLSQLMKQSPSLAPPQQVMRVLLRAALRNILYIMRSLN